MEPSVAISTIVTKTIFSNHVTRKLVWLVSQKYSLSTHYNRCLCSWLRFFWQCKILSKKSKVKNLFVFDKNCTQETQISILCYRKSFSDFILKCWFTMSRKTDVRDGFDGPRDFNGRTLYFKPSYEYSIGTFPLSITYKWTENPAKSLILIVAKLHDMRSVEPYILIG